MFQNKSVLSLFPSLVWVHELKREDYEAMNPRLLEGVEAIIAPRPPLKPGQTWQTAQDLHRKPDFAELVAYINGAVESALQFLELEFDGFEITGCWANVNPQGSPHVAHTHPNNFLSGVYYLRTPKGGDVITFHEPRQQLNIISPRTRRHTRHNTGQINVPVGEGKLIVFPAWFKHSVPPNAADSERVSISFNVMFSSFDKTVSPPKWEGISSQGATEERGQ
jgi:uncharacterized protein (TIGR02466 family)